MGEFNSLTNYLLVLKGENIRMVYNGTYTSMNTSIWDTHFALPTVGSTIRSVEKVTCMEDRDIG